MGKASDSGNDFWRRQWLKSTPYVDFSLRQDSRYRSEANSDKSVQYFRELGSLELSDDHPLSSLPEPSRRYIHKWLASANEEFEELEDRRRRSLLQRIFILTFLSTSLLIMSFLPLFVAAWLNERPFLIAMITTIIRTVLMSNLYFRCDAVSWRVCAKFLEERSFPSLPTAIFFAFAINDNIAAVRNRIWFKLMAAAVSGLMLASVSFARPLYEEWKLRSIRQQARTLEPPPTQKQLDKWIAARDAVHACRLWTESQKQLSLPMADQRSLTVSSLARAEAAIASFVPYEDIPRPTYSKIEKVPTMLVGLGIDISQLIAYREQPVFFAAILVRGTWTSVKMALLVFSPHVSLEETNNLFSNMYAGTFFTFITLTIWYLSIGPAVVAEIWSCVVITIVQSLLKQTLSNHTAPVLISFTKVIALPFKFVARSFQGFHKSHKNRARASDTTTEKLEGEI